MSGNLKKPVFLIQFFVSQILVNPLCAVELSGLSSGWGNDCVGRMQLSLPNNVEVAAVFPRVLIRELDANRRDSDYHIPDGFPDGTESGWSSFDYAGRLQISLPLAHSARAAAWAAAEKKKKRAKLYITSKNKRFVDLTP